MKKRLMVSLGICLFSFPLAALAEESIDSGYADQSISEELEDVVDETGEQFDELILAPVKQTSEPMGQNFLIKKEIPINSKEDDGTTNGKIVKLNGTFLNLHGAADYVNYLRFSALNIPEDAVLRKATLVFTTKSSSNKSTGLSIRGEIGENQAFSTDSHTFETRSMTDSQLTVQTPNQVKVNEVFEIENILPILEEMRDKNNSIDDVVFQITGDNTGKYIAKSFEAGPETAPKLLLEYEATTNEIEIPIASSTYTATENTSTKKVTTTGNLAMGGHANVPTDKNKQSLGLRFNEVELPDTAEIEEAYIKFVTATASKKEGMAHISISSELGDARAYERQDGNISNREFGQLVSRIDLETFKTKNDVVRTGDLKNIINEARLQGWQDGQSLGFKMEGDNYLGNVYSFNNKGNSPKLVIKYKQSDKPIVFEDVLSKNKELQHIFINEISTEGTVSSKASWIELYNDNEQPVLLNKNISLVNKKKSFDVSRLFIPAKGYRIIYMDGKNELGYEHSSFELSSSGTLSLIDTNKKEKRVIDSIDYTKHKYNQTIGRKPDGSDNVALMNEPTFKTSNNEAKSDANLVFDKERGLYPEEFDLTLDASSDLTIRYTLDGTDPTMTQGTIYKEPIKISQTTVVKAIAYNEESHTNVMAHSYILENNYKNEVKKGKEWQYKESISQEEYAKGLNEFPIISLTGVSTNLSKNQDTFGTFEYIDAHTQTSHGNYFSLSANKKYGQVSSNQYNSGVAVKFNRNALTKKAKYEFFEPVPGDVYKPVKKFAKLQLKEGQDGPQNDIYGLGYNRYDEKVTNTLAKQMGKLGLGSRYVHYFYNGRYFGVKTMRENFSEKMFEEYFGGNDDDYTKIRFQDAKFSNGFVEDKTSTVWPTIQKTVKEADFQKAKTYIDFEDLINTHILYMFVDTEREIDAVVQNSVIDNDTEAVKMKFNVNDTDGAFHNKNKTGTGQGALAGGGGTYRFKWNSDAISKRGAGQIFGTFSGNSLKEDQGNLEFKTMVKDQVAKQFGTFSEDKDAAPLSVVNVQKLIKANISELDKAYKLDAAYMSARKDMYQNWKEQQVKVLNQVPDRVNFSQEMWLKYHLAHTLQPVEIKESNNQAELVTADKNVTIYYTTDGTDPMGNDGVVSPKAIKFDRNHLPNSEEKLTIRAFQPNNWGPITNQ